MSSRALRRLKGKQRAQEAVVVEELTLADSNDELAESEEEQLDTTNVSPTSRRNGSTCNRKSQKSKGRKDICAVFEMVCLHYSSSICLLSTLLGLHVCCVS